MFGLGGNRPIKIGKEFSVGCEILSVNNKAGILKRNEQGHFCDIVFGALEFPNSGGSTYSLSSGEDLLRPGSLFHESLTTGMAKGEYWHPKREPGITDEQWFQRVMYTAEETTSHVHTQLWIDMIKPQGYHKKVPAFIGDLSCAGPYGSTLEKDLLNAANNVAFSIRSITDDIPLPNGTYRKSILAANGFDHVSRPGIKIAQKYQSVSLEDASSKVSIDQMLALAESNMNDCISFESAQHFKKVIYDIARKHETKVYVPSSSIWK